MRLESYMPSWEASKVTFPGEEPLRNSEASISKPGGSSRISHSPRRPRRGCPGLERNRGGWRGLVACEGRQDGAAPRGGPWGSLGPLSTKQGDRRPIDKKEEAPGDLRIEKLRGESSAG